RPPSTLPPPGDLTLEVSVQAKLGEGRVGFVYDVDKRGTSGSHAIPDLVIKVARRYQSNNLCREAWFYEEMEHLQGIIVARCYVLEKLGERIPKCVPLPVTVPELVETFSHLCQMGIQHRDVCWYNILRAPNSMENPVCPTHNHVHEWRIVDFDLAAKT
ncbi:hypothetical protein BU17DRAFT_15563, partial [Hysterangium stoloniferum]